MKRVYKTPMMKSEPVDKKIGIEDLEPDLAASVGDYTTRSGDASSVEMNFDQEGADPASSVVMNFNKNDALYELMKKLGVTSLDELAGMIEEKGGTAPTPPPSSGISVQYLGKQQLDRSDSINHSGGINIYFSNSASIMRLWRITAPDITYVKGVFDTSAMTFGIYDQAVIDQYGTWSSAPSYLKTYPTTPMDNPDYPQGVEVGGNLASIYWAEITALVGGTYEENSARTTSYTIIPIPDLLVDECDERRYDINWAAEFADKDISGYYSSEDDSGVVNVHYVDSNEVIHLQVLPDSGGDPDGTTINYLTNGKIPHAKNCLLITNTTKFPAKVHITLKTYPQTSSASKIHGSHIYSIEDGALFSEVPEYVEYREEHYGS